MLRKEGQIRDLQTRLEQGEGSEYRIGIRFVAIRKAPLSRLFKLCARGILPRFFFGVPLGMPLSPTLPNRYVNFSFPFSSSPLRFFVLLSPLNLPFRTRTLPRSPPVPSRPVTPPDVANGVRVSQLYNARGKKLAVAVQRNESNRSSEVSANSAATDKAAKRKSLIGTPKIAQAADPKHGKEPKQAHKQQQQAAAAAENRRRSSVHAPSAKSYANAVKAAAAGSNKPPLPPQEQSNGSGGGGNASKKLFRRIFQRQ